MRSVFFGRIFGVIPFNSSFFSYRLFSLFLLILLTSELSAIELIKKKHQIIRYSLCFIPSVIGYGFLAVFFIGILSLEQCWENPNCEANKLLIPFALSLFLFAVTVVLVELVFWRRYFRKNAEQLRKI